MEKIDHQTYRCVECGKVYNDQSNCRRHIKIAHLGQKELRDYCPFCEKLLLKREIKRHIKNTCHLAPHEAKFC